MLKQKKQQQSYDNQEEVRYKTKWECNDIFNYISFILKVDTITTNFCPHFCHPINILYDNR